MFSSLKYDQSDSIQKKESEEGDERHSGGENLVLNEKTIKKSQNQTKENQLKNKRVWSRIWNCKQRSWDFLIKSRD